jgi:hypothetical protein
MVTPSYEGALEWQEAMIVPRNLKPRLCMKTACSMLNPKMQHGYSSISRASKTWIVDQGLEWNNWNVQILVFAMCAACVRKEDSCTWKPLKHYIISPLGWLQYKWELRTKLVGCWDWNTVCKYIEPSVAFIGAVYINNTQNL